MLDVDEVIHSAFEIFNDFEYFFVSMPTQHIFLQQFLLFLPLEVTNVYLAP